MTYSQSFAEDLDKVLADVFQGKQRIVSYPQTSQYGPGGIGAAACGFAAVNCARTVFRLEEQFRGLYEEKKEYFYDLLRAILSYETTEEIVSICSSWKSSKHLEVEDLLQIPIFKNTFILDKVKYGRSNYKGFQGLLKDMLSVENNPVVAAVITRSPEILVCLKVPANSSDSNFFVVFDSHPRQNHPLGSGMIVSSSIDATATYLEDILGVDSSLADDITGYQAMLIGQYSGHIIVPMLQNNATSVDTLLMNSSIEILNMKSELSDIKRKESDLIVQNQELRARISRLEHLMQSVQWTKKKGKHQKNQRQVPPGPSKPNGWGLWSMFTGNESSITSPDAELSGDILAQDLRQFQGKSARQSNHRSDNTAGQSDNYTHFSTDNSDMSSQTLAEQLQRQFDVEHERMVFGQSSDRQQGSSSQQSSTRLQSERQFHSYKENAGQSTARGNNSTEFQKGYSRSQPKRPTYSAALKNKPKAEQSTTGHKTILPPAADDVPAEISSEILASRLQLQFDQENNELEAQAAKLQEQYPVFDCPLCLDTLLKEEVIQLVGCDHTYCFTCMRENIRSCLEQRKYPISCPVCVAEKIRAPIAIDMVVFEMVGLTDGDLAIFQEMQLVAHSIPLLCRKCNKAMYVDRNEYQEATNITCPLPGCNHIWCKDCQQTIEEGGPVHSCDGSAELNQLMKLKGWQHCPGCKIPIQKITGCNHMICSMSGCNTHFCYLCGAMIVRSSVTAEISSALGVHYSGCRMFEDVGGD